MSSTGKRNLILIAALFLAVLVFVSTGEDENKGLSYRTPEKALEMLKEGNERFVDGESEHPRTDAERLAQAGTENQGDHAYATVITCSDSRVPVERIFDAGIMDIFVIRVAGNVVQGDEAGSIEYGLSHVNTPVLVVLGHTQCGAVTAVTNAVQGHGHALERNIPGLVAPIKPAVEKAIADNPGLHGKDVIPAAIVENVWQGIRDLFMASPSTRELVKAEKVKVVGAIYNVHNGKVEWLDEDMPLDILEAVEENPARAMNAMADGHAEKAGSSMKTTIHKDEAANGDAHAEAVEADTENHAKHDETGAATDAEAIGKVTAPTVETDEPNPEKVIGEVTAPAVETDKSGDAEVIGKVTAPTVETDEPNPEKVIGEVTAPAVEADDSVAEKVDLNALAEKAKKAADAAVKAAEEAADAARKAAESSAE